MVLKKILGLLALFIISLKTSTKTLRVQIFVYCLNLPLMSVMSFQFHQKMLLARCDNLI